MLWVPLYLYILFSGTFWILSQTHHLILVLKFDQELICFNQIDNLKCWLLLLILQFQLMVFSLIYCRNFNHYKSSYCCGWSRNNLFLQVPDKYCSIDINLRYQFGKYGDKGCVPTLIFLNKCYLFINAIQYHYWNLCSYSDWNWLNAFKIFLDIMQEN